jgi:hypothetical protein
MVQGDVTHNNSASAVNWRLKIAGQLPEVLRMAMGATVFRIRRKLIFRWCWNLITPSRAILAGARGRGPEPAPLAQSIPPPSIACLARSTACPYDIVSIVSRNACAVGGTVVFNCFPSRRLIRARQQPGLGSNGSIRYPLYSVMGSILLRSSPWGELGPLRGERRDGPATRKP